MAQISIMATFFGRLPSPTPHRIACGGGRSSIFGRFGSWPRAWDWKTTSSAPIFPRCHPRIRIAWPLPEQVGKPEKLCEVAQNHWTDRWLLNPVMIRMNPQPGFYNLYLVCLKMRYHHVSLRRLLCRGLLNWRIPKTIGFHTKVAIRGFLHFRKSRFPEIHPYHPRNSPLPKLAAQFF